jgi:hypothetical protein
MDSARPTEAMLGLTRVESIGRKILFSLKEFEISRGHDQSEKAFLRANRAVAAKMSALMDANAKPHGTAMTSAFPPCTALHLIHLG